MGRVSALRFAGQTTTLCRTRSLAARATRQAFSPQFRATLPRGSTTAPNGGLGSLAFSATGVVCACATSLPSGRCAAPQSDATAGSSYDRSRAFRRTPFRPRRYDPHRTPRWPANPAGAADDGRSAPLYRSSSRGDCAALAAAVAGAALGCAVAGMETSIEVIVDAASPAANASAQT